MPPEEVVLFMSSSGPIAEMFKEIGVEFNDDEDEHAQAYKWMCENRLMAMADGRRTNLCRFGGLAHAIRKHVDYLHIDTLERSWVSLDMDMLGNRKLLDHIKLTEKQQQSENVGENSGTTSTKRVGVDEKVLRDCCQNAMVISVMVLQDLNNERKTQMLAEMSSRIFGLARTSKPGAQLLREDCGLLGGADRWWLCGSPQQFLGCCEGSDGVEEMQACMQQ